MIKGEKSTGGRQTGSKTYSETQVQILEACFAANLGPKAIIKKYPGAGFTVNGIKSAAKRFSKTKSIHSKQETRGCKKTVLTTVAVAAIADALKKNPKVNIPALRQ